ncbi:TIGR01777 family oxidoreductase [Marinifilum sp. D714]|uniref:TIGR01777 family oxidoreductase n=1 Tax=Marinifilum sp. D714 TaxID=2937523 RepID=UPI0027D058C3|nr:TIGR01777 family oxidoreductase [Marinifilum sp. D714]MDQ2177110.1 TIGR01777 family oxidoreductase [Marinifilum sp. D714]
MKIAISGSSGLVGSHLCDYLQTDLGAEILKIPRERLYGDAKSLAALLDGASVIIHLSGASILSRWTKSRKRILRDSRVETTKNLCKAVALLKDKPKQFICTSAVGIYNSRDRHSEESEAYSHDFLGKVCIEWEQAAMQMQKLNVRTAIFRLGVVLSEQGGIIQKSLPFFKLGIGGRLGSGKQMFPFIHIDDLMKAYSFVINERSEGIYNLVAPVSINNGDFTKMMAKIVKRPAFCHVPAFILRILLGEASTVLLNGQTVLPDRLKKEGFQYNYLTFEEALCALV